MVKRKVRRDDNNYESEEQRALMKHDVHLLAWNAAYWLARSEARRQRHARFPDCDWKQLEVTEECVATLLGAQADLCLGAMRPQATYDPASPAPPNAFTT